MKITQLLTIGLILICFFTLTENSSFAVATTWSKEYLGNNPASTILQTSDGGFVIGGVSLKGAGMLAKIDANGNLLWNQTYDGPSYIWVNSIIQTPDQGFLLAGTLEVETGSVQKGNTIINYYDPDSLICLRSILQDKYFGIKHSPCTLMETG